MTDKNWRYISVSNTNALTPTSGIFPDTGLTVSPTSTDPGTFTLAAGAFVAPRRGIYLMDAQLVPFVSTKVGLTYLQIQVNSTIVASSSEQVATNGNQFGISLCCARLLEKNADVELYYQNASTQTIPAGGITFTVTLIHALPEVSS